jgi:hypothetical protein
MSNKLNILLIGTFAFNLKGFDVIYSVKGVRTHLRLCPKATCELLQEAGLIEGFEIDKNGEPVILFTDNTLPAGYGFDQWASFVCFFKISRQMAVKLMEYREDRKKSRSFQTKVNYLLKPAQAA